MAFLGGRFQADQFDPNKNGGVPDPLPAGDYPSHIVKSEMKQTGDDTKGKGQMLVLEYEVISGPFVKRRFFDRLNLVNSSDVAERIAKEALSAICHSVGVLDVEESEELHFKPLLVTLKVTEPRQKPGKPNGEMYPAGNEVVKYRPQDGSDFTYSGPSGGSPAAGRQQQAAPSVAPVQGATQAASGPAAAPASSSTPSWRRNRAAG